MLYINESKKIALSQVVWEKQTARRGIKWSYDEKEQKTGTRTRSPKIGHPYREK